MVPIVYLDGANGACKCAKDIPSGMPRHFANYSELTPEETAARDAECEELIARSRILSSKTI